MSGDVEANQSDFAERKDHDDELKARNLRALAEATPLRTTHPNNVHVLDKIRCARGSIVDEDVEAIVNAANELLEGGGGVDGVIHSACGPELLKECLLLPRDSEGARCRTGDAKLTKAFRIKARFVIHTVGPYLDANDQTQPSFLFNCYYKSMRVAESHGLTSIAFPAISTGYYGFPIAEGATVAFEAFERFFRDFPHSQLRIRLVLFDELSSLIYTKMFT